jgi:hypothetical protein
MRRIPGWIYDGGASHPVMAAKAAIHAFAFRKQESGRFFEKKLRKKLLS